MKFSPGSIQHEKNYHAEVFINLYTIYLKNGAAFIREKLV